MPTKPKPTNTRPANPKPTPGILVPTEKPAPEAPAESSVGLAWHPQPLHQLVPIKIYRQAACIAAALQAMEALPNSSLAEQFKFALAKAHSWLAKPTTELLEEMKWAFGALGHPIDFPISLK